MSNPSTHSSAAAQPVASETLNAVFGALSHPMRRQILIVLYARGGRMTSREIADRFKCSWPTTTRHLGVLESAGVIEVSKEGRNRIYQLAATPLIRSADWIYSWAPMAAEAQQPAYWASLPYAQMRNATKPAKEADAAGSEAAEKTDKKRKRQPATKKPQKRATKKTKKR